MFGVMCIFTPTLGDMNRLKPCFSFDREYFSLVPTFFALNRANKPTRRLTNGENRLSRKK